MSYETDVDVVTIDGVVLEDFEVLEAISFGRVREIAVNKVAGGIVVIQDFGDFPPDVIVVRGTLYGAGCEDRSFQIEQLCKIKKVRTLTWRQWKYTGVVKKYTPSPKFFTEIPYELEFVPLKNDSSGASVDRVLDAPRLVKYAVSQLAKSINKPPPGLDFSDAFKNAFNELRDFITSNNTQQANFEKEQIAQAAAKMAKDLEAAKNSTDSQIASIAGDMAKYLNIIKEQSRSSAPYLEVPISNPNLPSLAAQYYGDHSKWELIAKANNFGSDTHPKGDFILKIPYSSAELEPPKGSWI